MELMIIRRKYRWLFAMPYTMLHCKELKVLVDLEEK